jgi:hypothetical protein
VPAPVAGPTCCTRKPYLGAAKKTCGVDQYGASPMDGSKNSWERALGTGAEAKGPVAPTVEPTTVPVAVPVRMPMAAAAAKGSVVPAAGALVPTKKGRPVEGWGRAAVPGGRQRLRRRQPEWWRWPQPRRSERR